MSAPSFLFSEPISVSFVASIPTGAIATNLMQTIEDYFDVAADSWSVKSDAASVRGARRTNANTRNMSWYHTRRPVQ